MKHRRNNKGLSLVELIVAIAILAIVGTAICGFVSFCSKSFASSNKNIKLQYDQQVVVNRVKDCILETSRGIHFEKDTATGSATLIVFSDNPDYVPGSTTDATGRYLITQLALIPNPTDTSKISFRITTVRMSTLTGLDAAKTKLSSSPSDELSDCVSAFDVDMSTIKDGKVTLTLTFKVGDKEITVNPIISLRNMIEEVSETTDFEDIYTKEVIETYSHVQSVVIKRGETLFAQGKTDTIAMAGDSTSVDYDAVVTKKKIYTGTINDSVTWEIDTGSLKEGFENCITINTATGVVTVKNVTKNGHKMTPNDYLVNGYFVITAISNEDPSRTAKLRIKVTSGGVYPVSIKTVTPYAVTPNVTTGQLVYKFEHEITYTDLIEDPITKNKVNPLKGEGVYTKIKYEVDEDRSAPIPKGAGFSALTDKVDGTFIVTKSMEEQTFYIDVVVLQQDKNGEKVYTTIELTIPKGSVPETQNITVPTFSIATQAERGTYNGCTPSWTEGVPTYTGNIKEPSGKTYKGDVAYYYWYEWEISNNNNECHNWGTGTRNSFGNVYLTNQNSQKQNSPYTTSQYSRIAKVYCQSYLDWSKSFTYTVTLRVKIGKNSNGNDSRYYKLPTNKDLTDNTTSNKSEAYSVTKTVTIPPVELTLTPADSFIRISNNLNSRKRYYVFGTSDKIGLGYDKTKSPYNRYSEGDKWELEHYYKMFTPSFKGLYVNQFNINGSWDNYGNYKAPVIKTSITQSLEKYYKDSKGKYVYKNLPTTDWNSGWTSNVIMNEGVDNMVYVVLDMTPSRWKNSTDPLLLGVRYKCVITDSQNNSVTAKFTTTGNEYMNYAFYDKYEGKY